MPDLSDKAIEAIEESLDTVLASINSNIDRLIGKLDTGTGGQLERMELAQLRATRKAIAKEFERFDAVADKATSFKTVTPAIKSRIKPLSISFTQANTALLKMLSDSTYNELAGIADQYVEKVSMAVIQGSITGATVADITKEVTQLIEGGTDAAGRSMAHHAKTIAATRYMEADATMTLEVADNIGAKHFRYSGSLIKDSRQWCKDHVDKIYTRAEVKKWRDQTWKGKKEGDPFVVRGGWNCRHYFVPVIKED